MERLNLDQDSVPLRMELKDGFGRKIDYLRVSVTDRCNFRCMYCMPETGVHFHPREDLLNFDELERVIRLLVGMGIEKVRLTGGEPTVRKDLLELVRRIGRLPLRSFGMTTNGYLLEPMIEPLKSAGLHRVNISLDTLRKDRFREIARFDGFDRTWKAIWKSLDAGFTPVKINMVVMRGINDDEIPDFVELTRRHAFHVRFIEYMPSSGHLGNRFEDQRIIRTDELKARVGRDYPLVPLDIHPKTGPAKMFKVKGFAGEIGFIDPYADHFCSSCNRVRLTSLGQLRWCLFSDDGIDLRAMLRNGKTDDEIVGEIRARIISDKPEHHPLGISDLVQVSTVFSQVGG